MWEPEHNVLNARRMADNIMAFIEANQEEALAWAGGGVRTLQQFSNSTANRSAPVYPSIAFADDSDAQAFGPGDLINGAYAVTFEIATQSPDPDIAVADARIYAKAVLSMMRNIPTAALIDGTGGLTATVLESAEVGFDEMRTNERQNDFMQRFQIRLTFQVSGAI